MSDHHDPTADSVIRGSHRGQSLVEFALVLPMLLVLLLGLADFGRAFAAGITLEAAARNAAEAAAQEYVQLARSGVPMAADDYARLHDVAIATACHETDPLPNHVTAGPSCTAPHVAVCVHDAATGDACGSEASAAPGGCTGMTGWSPGIQGGAATPLPYVEVRVCYRFTTIIDLSALRLPFGWGLSLGDIWLQKDRTFTIACYPSAVAACG